MKAGSPFQSLQSILNDFSPEALIKKQELLKQCSLAKITGKKLLGQYHNSLLFIMSYAQNKEVYSLAEQEMLRITSLVKSNAALREGLAGSGIAGTATAGAYSLTLVNWLLKNFSGTISVHSFDGTGIHPKEILKNTLPDAEFELLSEEKLTAMKWLERASGTKNKSKILSWLTDNINNLKASDLIRDQLFESLKLFVEIKPADDLFSKSFGCLNVSKRYFHSEGLMKKFDEHALINKKLPPEKKLSDEEKRAVIKSARVALCLLNRETDPVTYCEELNVKYFELERGLSIALFSIDAERRLPIESYIGFMMFKNGFPMCYGGAWLFGQRSLIGINIFESFRGGESAVVFAQLLRCYKMAFGANYFEVEPYQFGKNNPEGIQSGAFWFYYRFGFKPVDKKLNELALDEHNKILSTKGYRSPVEVLKLFTNSNLFVNFKNNSAVPLNPADLSKLITAKINDNFLGDRLKAFKWCVQKLKQERIIRNTGNSIGFNKLCWFFAMCFDWQKISEKERSILRNLIQAKGNSEFEYVNLLTRFPLKSALLQKNTPKLR